MNGNERDPLLIAAADLRERGVAPGRDLWADISGAIDRQERTAPLRRQPGLGTTLIRLLPVAAVLALAVVGPLRSGAGAAAQADPARQGLAVIDQALLEVNQALVRDPDNRGLTRLVGQLHRSRAELVRRDAEVRLRRS